MWNTLGGTSEPGWTSYWYCDAERPHQTWLLLGKPPEMAKQVSFESCLSLKWRRLWNLRRMWPSSPMESLDHTEAPSSSIAHSVALLNKPAYDLKKLHDKLNKLATTCQQFGRLAAQGWDQAIAENLQTELKKSLLCSWTDCSHRLTLDGFGYLTSIHIYPFVPSKNESQTVVRVSSWFQRFMIFHRKEMWCWSQFTSIGFGLETTNQT